ncbi:hypothetical protein DEO72_LG6g1460 [Vigna unguiculata]|uniref:Uncharacterized protein n=1 Tax=Vigna unguiculata TaxID=3917 RepID=A0A4D6M8N2_VIGUN|nr:hypothetical protein DEO72_LG6g1460 [Vigna unguiculata]
MNLPAYIITCSPPSMNLSTHGTTSLDPSLHQCVQQHTKANTYSTFAWHSLSAARRNSYADRLAEHPCRQAPSSRQTHCFKVCRLAEHTLPLGATWCSTPLPLWQSSPGGKQAVSRWCISAWAQTRTLLHFHHMATTMYTDAPTGRLVTFPPHGHHHVHRCTYWKTRYLPATWPPPCTPMHLLEDSLPSRHMATTMYTDAPTGRLVTFPPHGHHHVHRCTYWKTRYLPATWPPPCTPMHLLEDSLPSRHMATTMYTDAPTGRLVTFPPHGHHHVHRCTYWKTRYLPATWPPPCTPMHLLEDSLPSRHMATTMYTDAPTGRLVTFPPHGHHHVHRCTYWKTRYLPATWPPPCTPMHLLEDSLPSRHMATTMYTDAPTGRLVTFPPHGHHHVHRCTYWKTRYLPATWPPPCTPMHLLEDSLPSRHMATTMYTDAPTGRLVTFPPHGHHHVHRCTYWKTRYLPATWPPPCTPMHLLEDSLPSRHMATTMYTDAPTGRLVTFPPHGHHHVHRCTYWKTRYLPATWPPPCTPMHLLEDSLPSRHMATTMYTDAPTGRLVTFPPHGHHHVHRCTYWKTRYLPATWPPPCTPMHLLEDSLPSRHMATTMYTDAPTGRLVTFPPHGHHHVHRCTYWKTRYLPATWPPPCIPMHLVEDSLPSLHMATTIKYLKVSCCHTYRPQSIEHVRKPCYGSHIVTPGGVPKYEHSPTLTLAHWHTRQPEPQLKVPRVHPLSRATTQGKSFQPQPIECHVLNPYPEPQLKDTFRATTHGTPASPPRRHFKSHAEHLSQVSSHLLNTVGPQPVQASKTTAAYVFSLKGVHARLGETLVRLEEKGLV